MVSEVVKRLFFGIRDSIVCKSHYPNKPEWSELFSLRVYPYLWDPSKDTDLG